MFDEISSIFEKCYVYDVYRSSNEIMVLTMAEVPIIYRLCCMNINMLIDGIFSPLPVCICFEFVDNMN